MRIYGRLLISLLALASVVIVSAGGAQAGKDKAVKAPPEPIDGALVYRQTCNRCHNARTVDELNPASWELVIAHMRVRAGIPQRDVEALLLWMNPPDQLSEAERIAQALEFYPDIPQLSQTCVQCHDTSRVRDAVSAGQDTAWWTVTLRRMRSYGAKIDTATEGELVTALADRASKAPQE